MSKPKTLQELFSGPNSWVQQHNATDIYGSDISFASENATCFCMFGGLLRIHGGFNQAMAAAEERIQKVIDERYPGFRGESYVTWNDAPGRTIDEVRELVKLAGV